MPKRISDSARILTFFTEADPGKAEVIYDLVQDVMRKRLAPIKAARKVTTKLKKPRVNKETNAAADAYTQPV